MLPVAQDNEFATWRAYDNRFWPAKYLIDAAGRLRYAHFGEGAYEETESAIRELLAAAGRSRLAGRTRVQPESAREGTTPESYLGADRAVGCCCASTPERCSWCSAPRGRGRGRYGCASTGGPWPMFASTELDRPDLHLLALELEKGVQGYAFTFG